MFCLTSFLGVWNNFECHYDNLMHQHSMIKTMWSILMRHLILCRSVRVGVSVQSRDGKVEWYEYKKPLPQPPPPTPGNKQPTPVINDHFLMKLLILCRSVRVGVSVQSRDGKVEYEYKKPLPDPPPNPQPPTSTPPGIDWSI